MTIAIGRRAALMGGGAALAMPARRTRAEPAPVLRLGVLTDLSGPYAETAGIGSVIGAQQAIDEARRAMPGLEAVVVSADHQNKPDIGAAVAREWFDRDAVDVILDVPNSAVGLAVAGVARDKDRVFIASGAATTDLTGARCSPNTIHWTFDTYMLSRVTGGALVARGDASWFFIAADYALGQALQRDATRVIEGAGGSVVGGVRYPFPGTTDFSSYLVQAQSSGARVLGLANAGADTVNCIKQATEFGLTKSGVTLAAMLMFIGDVHAVGLPTAQGLVLCESFYWDLNDATRALAERMRARRRAWNRDEDWRPNMEHAGAYGAATHYLRTAHAMGAAAAKASGAATVAAMKARPTEDDAFGRGSIRADGRKLHPGYLFRVKSPAESTGPWDYYSVLATVPADDAARPLADGGCALLKT